MRFKVQGSKFKVPKFPISAFTLIELLVVIAIIALLAGLVIGVYPAIQEKKIRSRVKTELTAVEGAIEHYKQNRGFYPPDNLLRADRPSLYYELTATDLPPNPLHAQAESMGITNIVNIGGEDSHNFYQTVKPNQITEINGIRFLGVKATGPNGETFLPWQYDMHSQDRHNNESFDLWVEVKIGSKVERIGNWND